VEVNAPKEPRIGPVGSCPLCGHELDDVARGHIANIRALSNFAKLGLLGVISVMLDAAGAASSLMGAAAYDLISSFKPGEQTPEERERMRTLRGKLRGDRGK